jgi:hypothetical protein
MKIINLYENLLLEHAITSCERTFGKELFGQELGGSEKDTKTEKDYANAIHNFTKHEFGRNINPELLKALDNLKKCSSSYPEVLIPESTVVYRSVNTTLSTFINLKQPFITKTPFNYQYKANAPIQSWTTDESVASLFGYTDSSVTSLADEYFDEGYNKSVEMSNKFMEMVKVQHSNLKLALTLEYHTNSSEFLFKSKYFKLLSSQQHEDEVLRISNKPIQVLAQFNPNTDDEDFLSIKSMNFLSLLSRYVSQ